MSANPAYGEVAGIVLQENTVYSIAQTTSVAEYENIDRRTMHSESIILSVCGCNHSLFTGGANSPPQSKVLVPVSANPAYGPVTSVAVQQNNAFSILPPPPLSTVQTVQYENIVKKR